MPRTLTLVLDCEDMYQELVDDIIAGPGFRDNPGCCYEETEDGIRITLPGDFINVHHK